jgi:hypothetical protein
VVFLAGSLFALLEAVFEPYKETAAVIDIAPALVDAIKEQRVVLFLGSGASRGAKHPTGDQIPQGDPLRDLICDRFLGSQLKERPLNAVAAFAANEVGLTAFQSYIRDLLLPFEPADFHLLIPRFRWRAIATTNFDLIVEKAYAKTSSRLQNLVKTVKDGDSFEARLNRETVPLGFYKLHGCIDFYTDTEIPLILGNEQYASYAANRSRFYARFRDLGFEYPIIFAGYSISDPHIQGMLFDLTDPKIGRPPYYVISPGMTEIGSAVLGNSPRVCNRCHFRGFPQKRRPNDTCPGEGTPHRDRRW